MVKTEVMSEKIESINKALVLKAFDTLFNKCDYAAAERFWSPDYIQRSAHIEPGREGVQSRQKPSFHLEVRAGSHCC
jgi:predicted SnoaL-like aldol condensation-catalyzing enzyme